MEIFILIAELGLPIAGALVMGFFIFTILKQMMNELIDEVKTIHTFADVWCNDISGLDLMYGDHLFN